MLKVMQAGAGQTGQRKTGIPSGLVTSRAAMFAPRASTVPERHHTPAPSAASASTTQPKRPLPTPPKSKELDLDKALGWITINDKDITQTEYQIVIDDIKSGDLNLLEKNELGLNFLHLAARNGASEFFKLIQSMPDIWTRVKDHINEYSDRHCTVLGYLIKAHQYEFALKLMRDHSADYNALVHEQIKGNNDRSASMLRLAVASVFLTSFSAVTDHQKRSLILLVEELLKHGLQFFYTPQSHCPPVFELEENLCKKFNDLAIMQELGFSQEEYSLLWNIRLFKIRSPEVFDLFIKEAKLLEKNNTSAQKILSLLGKHEIFLSAEAVDRSQCLNFN